MRFYFALFYLVLVSACAEMTAISSGQYGADVSNRQTGFFAGLRRNSLSTATGPETSLSRGTDEFINRQALDSRPAGSAKVEVVDNGDVEISLINATVEAAAEAVLGGALKFRYTIAEGVDGRITIQSTGPIPKSALLELFEAALSANGARLERTGETVSIVPGASGNRSFRSVQNGVGEGATIIVAPLEFISAKQMVNLLDPLVEEGLNAIADKRRNLLLLSGPKPQLESAIDALNLFDVDVLRGKSIALVRLTSARPEDVVNELEIIFESKEDGLLEGVVEFIPNNRLSSVLVITSRSRYLAEAQKWIRELDRSASRARRYTQIYELQNRSASDIAPVLNQILGDIISTDSATTEDGGNQQSRSRSRVVADPGRNALVVRALRAEHEEIRKLLNDLDSNPMQVLLEATIAEVTLNDEVSLGVRWFFQSGNFGNTFSDVATGAISASFPGFSSVFSAGGTEAVLSALAGVTNVKIISSPTLMVLNNKEAVLQIGDQVPVATRTSQGTTDPDAPIVTTVEYRDTGVILKVQPQIGARGRVLLDISQEVSDVVSTRSSGIDSPTIRQRQISTSVLLTDGATLVLGGLIQETNDNADTKVPGAGDIPIFGALFRNRSVSKSRTELLILIRPRIVASESDARDVTTYWRNRLSSANSILRTGLGSPKHTIDDIFK